MMPDFLLEIGCEEIPARMLDAASAELQRRVRDLTVRERLAKDAPETVAFSTPRRLVVVSKGILATQLDLQEQVRGPAVKVAYKNGAPTAAAEAFARKVHLPLSKLERTATAKGEYLSARVTKTGRAATEVLAELLPKEIAALHWPKSMYWRAGAPERFVRPIRWIVAMLNDEIVPVEFAGVRAGAVSYGHRLLIGKVNIKSADAYQLALERAKVEPSPKERERKIRAALDEAAKKAKARWREDNELLNTVVNLTEWPSVIMGNFDRSYLELPQEVLVTVMRDHQKYFAVENPGGKLLPHFLAVLNTEGDPEGLIRHGNERVLQARFNDARFFWDADQKIPLRERLEKLKIVTFQKELGSYYDKTMRVQKLAGQLASELAKSGVPIDEQAVREAAQLAKTDLTTELVKEFTELQGIVGGLYGRSQGLSQKIADAIYDQYKPVSLEDSVPRTMEGAVLSIADKADTIAGMFALGLQPTGSKDPFALRRQANGIVKTIAERTLPFDIARINNAAVEAFSRSSVDKITDIEALLFLFFRERIEFYLRDVLGFEYDTVGAVLAPGAMDVPDIIARANAVSSVRKSEDFQQIAIAFKRTKNILSQAKRQQVRIGRGIEREYLLEDVEKMLAARVPELHESVEEFRLKKNYQKALHEISTLRPLVDLFFDKIMVMVDDPQLRGARLGLLAELLRNFSSIADFSEIVTEGKNT